MFSTLAIELNYCPRTTRRYSKTYTDRYTQQKGSWEEVSAKLGIYTHLEEPVKLRSMLAVRNFPKILKLNYSLFVLNLLGCRQFRHQTIHKRSSDVSPWATNS